MHILNDFTKISLLISSLDSKKNVSNTIKMGIQGNGCPWKSDFDEQTLKSKTLALITASVN